MLCEKIIEIGSFVKLFRVKLVTFLDTLYDDWRDDCAPRVLDQRRRFSGRSVQQSRSVSAKLKSQPVRHISVEFLLGRHVARMREMEIARNAIQCSFVRWLFASNNSRSRRSHEQLPD